MRLRLATLNIENLDEPADAGAPPLEDRLRVLRPILDRLRADVLCLQEVHGQERPGAPRRLLALDALLDGTRYEDYHRATTLTSDGVPYDVRNLVTLSRFPITERRQVRNDLVPPPRYAYVTEQPSAEARPIRVERPILHTVLDTTALLGGRLHVLNVHLKSKRPTNVNGQRDGYRWRSASGWAEGYFVSSMKRVSQALECRVLIDALFDAEGEDVRVAVTGDFNSGPLAVPAEAIVGRIVNTQNGDLLGRELVPCALSVSDSQRYTHIYHGQRALLDHVFISRALVPVYAGAEVHNEYLRDESIAFAFETLYPEPDHAGFVAIFDLE